MSMRRERVNITLPRVLNEWLEEMMEEIGLDKSHLLENMAFYVSMPENLQDFKDQFVIGDAGEEEDDEEEDEEEDDVEGPDIIGELLGGDEVEDEEEEE